MKITQMLLTPNKYSRPQLKLPKVTKVAVHYTGNPGSTAKNNRDYFNNAVNHHNFVSSHYIVGLDGEVIQCIPETEWSYCTNQANGYSISIETCHPDSSGKFLPATEKSLIELCADICKRQGLNPQKDLIRHYDVTKKVCPKWYVDHPDAWAAFKTAVAKLMGGTGKTGWVQASKVWYWYEDGEPVKSKWVKDKGYWYYLGADGAMLTGLRSIGGKLYYLNTGTAYGLPAGACVITDSSGAVQLVK